MLDLGSTDFYFAVPSLPRDELEAFSSKLFDTWEAQIANELPLDDYSLTLEIEEGSIKGSGKVTARLIAVGLFISNYGSIVQGLQTMRSHVTLALDARYLRPGRGRFVYLHAMHSVVDWFAYALWKDGTLIRSLSVSPDNGVIEDLGQRRAFEEPFWSGERAVDADDSDESNGYPLPFHPLELGEAALLDLFGFQLEGPIGGLDPFDVPLCSFERKRKWLGLW